MGRRAKPAKGKAEAKRSPVRKSPEDDGAKVRDLEKRLAEAQEQQRATSDILRAISGSPNDIQPVFDAIARNARELLAGHSVSVTRLIGDQAHLMAFSTVNPEGDAVLREGYPVRLDQLPLAQRTVREGTATIVDDVETHSDATERSRRVARARGFRSFVWMPMVHGGATVGWISVTRTEPGPFSDNELVLLKTFADQAVIAIENVRLFTELEARNRDLTEALQQQTATAEILRVIASSPTDIQPVLNAVAQNAARVCGADDALIYRVDGDVYQRVAHHGPIAETAAFERRLSRDSMSGRATVDRRTIHVPDIEAAPGDELPETRRLARLVGARTHLAAPLIREGAAIGAILIRCLEVRPFAPKQISLLETFADQAVIAIENVRLFNETKEALEQQTSTAEILRVIASSPTDLQSVLDAVAESAARLCEASDVLIHRVDGQMLPIVASVGSFAATYSADERFPINRGSVVGRAVMERKTIHIHDLAAESAEEFPIAKEFQRRHGHRTVLTTPLMREGMPLGAIWMRRTEVRPFTDKQIKLLETFADQAVIAIENARLFTELQEKNQAVTLAHAQVSESLEQQTATAEILSVISGSPTDIRPVFDAVLNRALTLCEASNGSLYQLEDGALRHVGVLGIGAITAVGGVLSLESAPGWAVLEKRTVHIEDVLQELDRMAPEVEAEVRRTGVRTVVAVPLLREQTAIGAIFIRRLEVRPFSERQIRLLQTFADQAVIAIENVRLFTELQASNRELTTALDTQTATSDILRVISRSQTDVQPVFETIVRNAVGLCGAVNGGVYRFDGELIHSVAHEGFTAEQLEDWRRHFPRPVTTAPGTGNIARAIVTRRAEKIVDIEASDLGVDLVTNLRARGVRSTLAVPMLRQGEVIGVIGLTHREVNGFADSHVELLQTFADQAVIAIENVRLFKELEARTQELTRSVGELTALGEVGRALSSTLNLETVLQTIVLRANELAGTAGCTIWEYDEAREEFRLRASDYPDEADAALLQGVDRLTTIHKGVGVTTQVMERRQPVQVADIVVEGADENPIRRRLIEAGHHALLGVPLLSEDEVIGVLTVTRKIPGEFAPETVRLLTTFATQSALAIQNARLFLEIEDKSRQLEAASQHKSEFLANMSHELRTPLNAIIGFSEVLTARMFGELNEKQDEYLKDIYASGQHLLSLINDILDLSKIEAGRMELEPTDFDLPSAIDNAMTLVRERASRRGITLGREIDERVGTIRADERKVKQVVLNLLSNAIKFTPEGGRIDVRAVVNNGTVEVSVTDTGVGIAPEDQETVFEEFRQVGTADKKVEGTGLGLALSRKFIELHGGRIWVESQVGQGSTFTFTVPVRQGDGATLSPPG